MRCLVRLAFFYLVVVSTACSSKTIDKTWFGEYEYRNSFWDGNQSVITDITLKVSPDGGCSISWEGFQKSEQIICSADFDLKKNGLSINFISYSNGSYENEYGVVVYKPKSRLFLLTRSNRNVVLTTWSELYRPPKTNRVGVYLKKID